MPVKKREQKYQSTIRVGNIGKNRGTIQIAGRDIKSQQSINGLSAAQIDRLFNQLYRHVESRAKISSVTKKDLKAEVKDIQATVTEAAQNNKKVNASFLSRHFRNIARMAPDVLDVVVATLGNPLAGLGVAAKKIAEKAKAETKAA